MRFNSLSKLVKRCPGIVQNRRITSWLSNIFQNDVGSCTSIRHGLKTLYKSHLEPLEAAYFFHNFHSPPLRDADFDLKPSVMIIGQYSTGKTTFLQHIVGKEYPGSRIGPEPTTDKFMVVMNGEEDHIIPGNALVVDSSLPYSPLSKFGNKFLNRFQACCTQSAVLENLTLIDTPGILSGQAQLIDRGYDFKEVVHWFAERVDRVILLFDAHKLDISDEFKSTIQVLNMYEDKIRIVLNKSDRVSSQQLMRVYGALMWSLGKIVNTPEVARVYLGSFWKQPLQYDTNRDLFELEHQDLFKDLQNLPKQNALRKLNDFIRRARLAKVHAYIIGELKSQMPTLRFYKKDSVRLELIDNLAVVYKRIQARHGISPGDFPDVPSMQRKLMKYDFSSFKALDEALLRRVDEMLSQKIPPLMSQLPEDVIQLKTEPVAGGIFDQMDNKLFGRGTSGGFNEGMYDSEWIVSQDLPQYQETFKQIAGSSNYISASQVKPALLKSHLPSTELALIWKLADVNQDDCLDLEEWALANHLLKTRLGGHELPQTLPTHLIPPSQREKNTSDSTPDSNRDASNKPS